MTLLANFKYRIQYFLSLLLCSSVILFLPCILTLKCSVAINIFLTLWVYFKRWDCMKNINLFMLIYCALQSQVEYLLSSDFLGFLEYLAALLIPTSSAFLVTNYFYFSPGSLCLQHPSAQLPSRSAAQLFSWDLRSLLSWLANVAFWFSCLPV